MDKSYTPLGSGMRKNLDAHVHFRFSSQLLSLIRRAAAVDKRPVSQWVRVVLERAALETLKRAYREGPAGQNDLSP